LARAAAYHRLDPDAVNGTDLAVCRVVVAECLAGWGKLSDDLTVNGIAAALHGCAPGAVNGWDRKRVREALPRLDRVRLLTVDHNGKQSKASRVRVTIRTVYGGADNPPTAARTAAMVDVEWQDWRSGRIPAPAWIAEGIEARAAKAPAEPDLPAGGEVRDSDRSASDLI